MNKDKNNWNKKVIIDIHCHTAGIGAGGSNCYISPALRRSWKYGIYLRAFGVTEKQLCISGDGLVIKRLSQWIDQSRSVSSAVILAMDGVVDSNGELDYKRSEIYVPNTFVAGEVKKYSNLLFGSSINPYRKDAIERLERAREDNAMLLKWLPSIQHIDPADKKLTPFYIKMIEMGIPLLTHTGDEHSFTKAENTLSDPQRLTLPLDLGVTVIAAHAATNGRNNGMRNFDRIVPMFARYSNLFADISSLTQFNKISHLQTLLRYKELQDRLLYGTDMPILNTGAVSPFAFALQVGIGKALHLSKTGNPWDQDIALKQALGVPEPVFTRASGLLSLRKIDDSIYTLESS